MAALASLLTTGKVDPEKLKCAGLSEQPATAGLTWAQLLKRPEVTIEPLLSALRDDLACNPLLAEFASHSDRHPEPAQRVEGPAVAFSDAEGAPSFQQFPEGETGERVGKQPSESLARAALRNQARAVETEIKFAGYIEQQRKSIEKLKAAEAVAIPDWIDYGAISGLSREMHETLERVRPITIGQASRIPGVTPAALSLVHVSIRLQGARRRRTA